jgi:predicted RNA-binding protein with PUA-like domain
VGATQVYGLAPEKVRPKGSGRGSKHISTSITFEAMPTEKDLQEGSWGWVFTPRKPREVRYWLVKSEPDVFSFDDLLNAPKKTTTWDGVRNFAARNFLRFGMKQGDEVFFYHSSTNPQAIVGICEVSREGYPDESAFDRKHPGYDEKSKREEPGWFAVDLTAVKPLPRPVTLVELKAEKDLADMALLRIGRLSVTPVTPEQWRTILRMAEKAPSALAAAKKR